MVFFFFKSLPNFLSCFCNFIVWGYLSTYFIHLLIQVIFNECLYCVRLFHRCYRGCKDEQNINFWDTLISDSSVFFNDKIKIFWLIHIVFFRNPTGICWICWGSFREVKGNIEENFTLCKANMPDWSWTHKPHSLT